MSYFEICKPVNKLLMGSRKGGALQGEMSERAITDRFKTLGEEIGTHPKIVQELLGHSQIYMTLDIYSHVLPTLQERAMTHLNTLLTAQDLSLRS